MVANAPLSIVSSVIGGGLVLAGQFFVKRAEDKRVWLIACRRAATANDRRRAGVPVGQVETATRVVDRQKALGRFRTLPCSDFEAPHQAMGRGIERVWRAWNESDEEFQLPARCGRQAVSYTVMTTFPRAWPCS